MIKNDTGFEKFMCRTCTVKTNHKILFKHGHVSPVEIFEKNDDGTVGESAWIVTVYNFKFIECMGCETPSVVIEHLTGPADEDKNKTLSYFPTRVSRQLPSWVRELPIDLMELFFEVYGALANGMPRLSLMGARTIFDMVALEKVGDAGGFKKKLNLLKTNGYISQKQSEILDKALDAGNAASHRGFKPDDQLLGGVLDIIENLVGMDELERKASHIESNTPKRH